LNNFWRVVIFATIVFIVADLLPLAWLNFVACWAVVVVAAYRYPHLNLGKVQAMSSSVGYGLGMGAAIGAIVNTVGVLGAFVGHAFIGGLGVAAGHSSGVAATAGLANSVSALGEFFQLFSAPVWGAILGLIGGLVGGSTVPKLSMTAPPPTLAQ
jgi:hypothetical protein